MTVREALNALRADGRIVSEKGRGVYVSAPPPLRTALRTLGIRGVERPALIGEMPALPTSKSDRDLGPIDIKVEAYAPGSSEARSGFAERVLLEYVHGDGFAMTQYILDRRVPLSGGSTEARNLALELHTDLQRVEVVRESITARSATPHEISALGIPRDLPVLVTRHEGVVGNEVVATAHTVRDSRFPIILS